MTPDPVIPPEVRKILLEQAVWVKRIIFHLYKSGMTHKVEKDGLTLRSDPYQHGRADGQIFWVCRSKHEGFRQVLMADKGGTGLGPPRPWSEYIAQLKKNLAKYLEEEPFLEAVRYFKGFAKGAEEGMLDEKLQSRGAPLHQGLYQCLIKNWPKINMMANRTEVYTWLCGELGQQVMPDLEAFQKICNRFGIKKAGRGRPRKK